MLKKFRFLVELLYILSISVIVISQSLQLLQEYLPYLDIKLVPVVPTSPFIVYLNPAGYSNKIPASALK
jgi:hypothetical protein